MVLDSKDVQEMALEAIEVAKATGKIRKGTNETTKAVEKGIAKLAVIAKDVNPPEITMHIPVLCEEKGTLCVQVATKEELGAAAGLEVGTSAVTITKEGDAAKILKQIQASSGAPAAADKAEEAKEEKEETSVESAEEPAAEEKKEEDKDADKKEEPAKEEAKQE